MLDLTIEQTLIKAQKEYCEQNGLLMIMPDDCMCYECGANIAVVLYGKEVFSHMTHIASCPVCCASFWF